MDEEEYRYREPSGDVRTGTWGSTVKIAFVIYDGLTLLDFAGTYDPLTRLRTMGFLPDLTYTV